VTANAVADRAAPPTVDSEEDQRGRRRKAIVLLILLAGLLVLLLIFGWYMIFRKPLNPLPIIPDALRMPAYATSIYGPHVGIGVAASSDGSRIYVAETEGDRALRVFDAGGKQLAAVRPPAETGPEHVLVWLAVDPTTSNLYATDRATGEIYIFDREGTFQRTLTLAKRIPGWQPIGIAFDRSGNLYVTDMSTKTPQIEVISPSGNMLRTFGEDDNLSFANGLAVDKAGNTYVADSNNGRLMVYGTDGQLIAQVGRGAGLGKLGLPRGVAVDDDGRVYVGDATAQGVHVFGSPNVSTHKLEYLGFFGGEGIRDGRFNFPNGVAIDARGRIYVADTFNDRVQIWSY